MIRERNDWHRQRAPVFGATAAELPSPSTRKSFVLSNRSHAPIGIALNSASCQLGRSLNSLPRSDPRLILSRSSQQG